MALATMNLIRFIFYEPVKAFFEIISESIMAMNFLAYLLVRGKSNFLFIPSLALAFCLESVAKGYSRRASLQLLRAAMQLHFYLIASHSSLPGSYSVVLIYKAALGLLLSDHTVYSTVQLSRRQQP